MTDTEREALCKRIDELCQENERLKGENAKLGEERREYQTTIDSLVDECTDHKDENAKLRELVREMWEYIYIGTAQDGQSLHDRTRELGIEVPA